MSARRLCLGVYHLLASRAERGVAEVDEMLAAAETETSTDPVVTAAAVVALGGEVA